MRTDKVYHLVSTLAELLLPVWIFLRALRGKEDYARRRERYGIASLPRPKGTLMWIHGASVGEACAVLPWIERMRERYPEIHVLLTTGTRTSARLMAARLPGGAVHQYVPFDTPQATERFMRHWRPNFALFVESELWPNLIQAADRWHAFLGILNARMSERSFAAWQRRASMITDLLSRFDVIIAQSDDDAGRFRALGARRVVCGGNLKYDAPALPYHEDNLAALQQLFHARPVWLAASTHPGEESLIASAQARLVKKHPGLLTLIVPRHPERGESIARELGGGTTVCRRSLGETISAGTAFYIADTLGELGLFYRACDIVFMGGSLVRHGGQNPLEPARLSCALLAGPHTHNFEDTYREMETAGALRRVSGADDLARQVGALLGDSLALLEAGGAARRWVETKGGALDRHFDYLRPALS